MKEILLPENISLLAKIGLYTFYASAGVQFIFLWIIFLRFAFFTRKAEPSKAEKEAVSVIVVAKNEYSNLKKNLPLILEQDYPEFEVILVNHASEDDTEYLARELQEKYPGRLQYVPVQDEINFFAGKKFPLSVGIKSARYEELLLTDADCRPASDQWIAGMQSKFSDKKSIVLGYGAYEEKKGLLNKLIRFDALRVGTLYLSLASWGMPYMGVGRNLAYKRSLFFEQNGFQSHLHIPSGDDDLFINAVAKGKNTAIAIGEKYRTISLAHESFSDWFYQKRRHLTTGKLYKFKHLFILGLWDISTFLFFVLGLIFLVLNFQTLVIASFLAWRVLSQLVLTKKSMLLLGEKKLLLLSPILELFLLISNPVITIINTFSKKRKW